MKKHLIVICSLFLFISCQKEDVTNNATEKRTTKRITNRQPVDPILLRIYVDYYLAAESAAMVNQKNQNNKIELPKMSSKEFEKMINNYLANEANAMRCAPWYDGGCISDEVIDVDSFESFDPFVTNGILKGSSITNILFTGSINNGVISGQGWSFSGTNGTFTAIGELQQSIHNGVTTYMQYFQEQITLPFGVNYTQQFVVYGNIYEGTATLNAMYNNPKP